MKRLPAVLAAASLLLALSACSSVPAPAPEVAVEQPIAPAPVQPVSQGKFTYHVEGSAAQASVTMSNPAGGTQQVTTDLPMRSTSGGLGVGGTAAPGSFLYVSAQNRDSSGTVTCRIVLDGVTVSENTSSGAYVIAACEWRVG